MHDWYFKVRFIVLKGNKLFMSFKKIFSVFNNKINIYEKIYISIIVLLILISCILNIPTDTTNIGISSTNLAIGDRIFYINQTAKGYGYENYSGNFFYPFVLKIITFLAGIFGQDQYSGLWNLFTILVTSTLSIFTLNFLRKSTLFFFQKRTSNIVCILFLLNPYSYFYSLSGGLTNYLTFGVTLLLFLFSRAYKAGYKLTKSNLITDNLFVCTVCVYLASLRVTGAFFGFIIILFLLYRNLSKLFADHDFDQRKLVNVLINLFGILLVTINFVSVVDYANHNLYYFTKEPGLFFGYPREILRAKLNIFNESLLINLKNIFYIIVWKLTAFVSGLSDIRDTHSSVNIVPLFPFMARTFTGIFILYPINILCFFGIITSRKIIINSDIWILLLACFIAVSPSFLGISLSRYLMMVYTPFMIFGALALSNIFSIKPKTK